MILRNKILRELVSAYRNKGLTLVLMLGLTVLGLVSPLLHGALLDALHKGRTLRFVLGIVGATVTLELISLGLGVCLEAVRVRSGAELVATLRNRVWGHLASIPMQMIYRKTPGEWMQRLNGDTELVCGAFQSMAFGFLNFGLFFIGTAAIIFVKSPLLLLFFAVVVAIGIFTHHLHKTGIVRRARQVRDGSYVFSSATFDLLVMHPLFRMFRLKEVFLRKFSRQNGIMVKRQVAAQGTSMHYSVTLGVEMALVHGTILAVCITMYSCGRIALGDIWVYDMLVSQLTGGVNRLLEMLPQMDQGRESGKSLAEFFAIAEEDATCVSNQDCASSNRESDVVRDSGLPYSRIFDAGRNVAIKFSGVSFAYERSQVPVIHGCTLSVLSGEMVCIIGRNGAGKSTLVNLVLGILKPTEGEIVVGFNRPAIVPQRVTVFTGSAFENIRLYDESIDEDTVWRVAFECGLAPWLSTLRNGLKTKISPETVSGGELQRLAIARALVRSPDLLIVDEITNNLDIIEKRRVREILQCQKKRRTILAVTHDIDMTEDADRSFAFTGETIHEVLPMVGESIAEAAIREIGG